MKKIRLILIALFVCGSLTAVTVLFDNTKEETAGNADWVIGTPPNWIGGFSDYGQALRDLGYETLTLNGSQITSYALQNCDVFIIPEPQNPFTNSEKQAILDFVQNGGGLFMIADHDGADRNNNGWDAQDIFDYSLQSMTYFHMSFNSDNEWLEPASYIESPRTFITENINRVGMWAGSTMSANYPAEEHIWREYSHYTPLLVTCEYGNGRVVGWGDSSTFDDGTGNPGNTLYDGWTDYDDALFAVNIVRWLLREDVGIEDNEINGNKKTIKLKSNPAFREVSFFISAEQPQDSKINIFNIKGQLINSFLISDGSFDNNGQFSLIWNGTDKTGKSVRSGVYFFNLQTNKQKTAFEKLILIK